MDRHHRDMATTGTRQITTAMGPAMALTKWDTVGILRVLAAIRSPMAGQTDTETKASVLPDRNHSLDFQETSGHFPAALQTEACLVLAFHHSGFSKPDATLRPH